MKSLEEIKYNYNVFRIKPSDDEIKFYSITDEMLKKWIIERALEFQKKLYNCIDTITFEYNNSINKIELMEWIPIYFSILILERECEDYYYQEILKIFKKMYENDMFDYLSFK